jgi:predicted ATPase
MHRHTATWEKRSAVCSRLLLWFNANRRAAMRLIWLWQQPSQQQKAHALLAPPCRWFTERFDTCDLQEAKAWLDELAG